MSTETITEERLKYGPPHEALIRHFFQLIGNDAMITGEDAITVLKREQMGEGAKYFHRVKHQEGPTSTDFVARDDVLNLPYGDGVHGVSFWIQKEQKSLLGGKSVLIKTALFLPVDPETSVCVTHLEPDQEDYSLSVSLQRTLTSEETDMIRDGNLEGDILFWLDTFSALAAEMDSENRDLSDQMRAFLVEAITQRANP